MKRPFRADWNKALKVATKASSVLLELAVEQEGALPQAVKCDPTSVMLATEVVLLRGTVAALAKELFDRMDDIQSSIDSLNRR